MGVKEGRAFSSDLHSLNESFRILLHFKEKMPSLSTAPPHLAGQAGSVLALLTCKWRKQGVSCLSSCATENLQGRFQSTAQRCSYPASINCNSNWTAKSPDRAPQTCSFLPERHRCCFGLGCVSEIQEGHVSFEPILKLCHLPSVRSSAMGKPQPWDMGFGVSSKRVVLPYSLHQHRPILSLDSCVVEPWLYAYSSGLFLKTFKLWSSISAS